MSEIVSKLGSIVGQSLDAYHQRVKPTIDDLKFKEQYQSRIIECMIGEVDDNYIETPETNNSIVKLEHSKEGLVKVPTIKGKTILVDGDGNVVDTPAEGCRLVSVGEEEGNRLIILSNNKNFVVELIKKGINSTNGTISNSNSSFISNAIPIDIYKNYVVGGLNSEYRSFVAFYDKDMKFIKRTSGTTHKLGINISAFDGTDDESATTYKLPRNTNFIIVTQYSIDSNLLDTIMNIVNIQIEEGTIETSYVEPKQHKSEILLNEPLRSLQSGVCDEIVGDKLIRRVGIRKKDNVSKINKAKINKSKL